MRRNPVHYLLAIVLLCLIGCTQFQAKLPAWGKQLPSDEKAFYAFGQGVDVFNAEDNARISLASQFGALVNDSTSIYVYSDGQFSQSVIEVISSVDVLDIKLTHAKVIKQTHLGNHYFVLLELPKHALAEQLKADVSQNRRDIQRVLSARSNDKDFGYWWTLRQVLPIVKTLERNSALLSSIERSPRIQDSQLITAYYKTFNRHTASRKLSIINRTKSKTAIDVVSKQLNKENISITDSNFFRRSDYVELSSHYSRQKIGQEFYMKGTLSVKLRLSSGQVLSTFDLSSQNISLNGYSAAKQRVINELLSQLDTIDIVSCLVNKKMHCTKGI